MSEKASDLMAQSKFILAWQLEILEPDGLNTSTSFNEELVHHGVGSILREQETQYLSSNWG